MLAEEISKPAKRLNESFTVYGGTVIKNSQHQYFAAMQVCRQKRQRRSFAQHRPDIQVPRRGLHELTITVQNLWCFFERKHKQPGEDRRADVMELEFKLRHDAKVATSAPDSPEQVRVLIFAGAHLLPVRQNHIRRHQVVDRHPIFPCEPAEAASQRKSGYSRC